MVTITAYFFIALYFYYSYYATQSRDYPVNHKAEKTISFNIMQLREEIGLPMKINKYIIIILTLILCVNSNAQTLSQPTLEIEAGKFPVVPRSFIVHNAYPNPFNPATLISFDIPKAGKVNVAIYNLLGEKIVPLVDQEMTPGWKRIPWHAGSLPSGIYFYRVSYDRHRITNKLMFIK